MPVVFDVRSSPLLRLAVAESRFTPFEFYNDGAYPNHRDAKEEVEAFVRDYVSKLDAAALDTAFEYHREYLSSWVPDRVEGASTPEDRARLCAFAELHDSLITAEANLMLDSLLPAQATDPVFDDDPALFGTLTEGLLRLTPENIEDQWTATNAVFFVNGAALFPHPFLAEYRELLGLLADLASDPKLRVYTAIHPYRRVDPDELQYRLLEDYWDGVKLTAETLDSLDRHDQGASFHAAGERGEAEELFNPLLGTWFDWKAREDDQDDPVKRLYIREVKPPVGSFGRELSAVMNRALHSERDTRARRFTHVDGKVCRFPVETYAPSANNPRAEPGPPERERKLWRVDGDLTDEQWFELVGLFFRGNELIEEHFREAFPSIQSRSE
jgi:hypothetical protein